MCFDFLLSRVLSPAIDILLKHEHAVKLERHSLERITPTTAQQPQEGILGCVGRAVNPCRNIHISVVTIVPNSSASNGIRASNGSKISVRGPVTVDGVLELAYKRTYVKFMMTFVRNNF